MSSNARPKAERAAAVAPTTTTTSSSAANTDANPPAATADLHLLASHPTVRAALSPHDLELLRAATIPHEAGGSNRPSWMALPGEAVVLAALAVGANAASASDAPKKKRNAKDEDEDDDDDDENNNNNNKSNNMLAVRVGTRLWSGFRFGSNCVGLWHGGGHALRRRARRGPRSMAGATAEAERWSEGKMRISVEEEERQRTQSGHGAAFDDETTLRYSALGLVACKAVVEAFASMPSATERYGNVSYLGALVAAGEGRRLSEAAAHHHRARAATPPLPPNLAAAINAYAALTLALLNATTKHQCLALSRTQRAACIDVLLATHDSWTESAKGKAAQAVMKDYAITSQGDIDGLVNRVEMSAAVLSAAEAVAVHARFLVADEAPKTRATDREGSNNNNNKDDNNDAASSSSRAVFLDVAESLALAALQCLRPRKGSPKGGDHDATVAAFCPGSSATNRLALLEQGHRISYALAKRVTSERALEGEVPTVEVRVSAAKATAALFAALRRRRAAAPSSAASSSSSSSSSSPSSPPLTPRELNAAAVGLEALRQSTAWFTRRARVRLTGGCYGVLEGENDDDDDNDEKKPKEDKASKAKDAAKRDMGTLSEPLDIAFREAARFFVAFPAVAAAVLPGGDNAADADDDADNPGNRKRNAIVHDLMRSVTSALILPLPGLPDWPLCVVKAVSQLRQTVAEGGGDAAKRAALERIVEGEEAAGRWSRLKDAPKVLALIMGRVSAAFDVATVAQALSAAPGVSAKLRDEAGSFHARLEVGATLIRRIFFGPRIARRDHAQTAFFAAEQAHLFDAGTQALMTRLAVAEIQGAAPVLLREAARLRSEDDRDGVFLAKAEELERRARPLQALAASSASTLTLARLREAVSVFGSVQDAVALGRLGGAGGAGGGDGGTAPSKEDRCWRRRCANLSCSTQVEFKEEEEEEEEEKTSGGSNKAPAAASTYRKGFSRCARCRSVVVCSAACQIKCWHDHHRFYCGLLQRLKQEAKQAAARAGEGGGEEEGGGDEEGAAAADEAAAA